jgi:putative Holliday junction resolvase
MAVGVSNPSQTEPGTPARAVLAIDYGRRRLGLALSDTLGMTARPLAVWERTNRRKDLARIRELCREHAVGRIVVGWPIRLDGTRGEMAQEAAGFADRLRKHLGRPVELADERLTSWDAGQQLLDSGSRRPGAPVDDVAATIILRDYLARSKQTEAQPGHTVGQGSTEKAD